VVDKILLYISAANDLLSERDLIGRSVTEIPVSLGWNIIFSPLKEKQIDTNAISQADLHILMLGQDIRAPIGFEWLISRRGNRNPILFLKKAAPRTPAARDFIRTLQDYSSWLTYNNHADLRHQTLVLISKHILNKADYFALTPLEYEELTDWNNELEDQTPEQIEETQGGAGDSNVIISSERFVPRDGVLLQPSNEDNGEQSIN
jgi:hypothetical protein